MGKPIVAVVGRPNVGKSTLFNKLVGQRLAIVEDTPGVTRDRIFGECEWQNREFLLVDTGGIDPNEADGILAHIRQQAQVAIDAADCIIMVTDINAGVTAQDRDVAALLMRSGKPVVLAVNKCDKVGEPPLELYDFYSLGLGEVFPVSSVHGHGTGDLLDAVCAHLPDAQDGAEEDERITLSTVHSSKGLEWSAVLIIDLVEDRFPSRHALVRPEDFEEERRLLYVGVTRASEAVYASHAARRRLYGRELTLAPSRFLALLPDLVVRTRLVRHTKVSSTQMSLV